MKLYLFLRSLVWTSIISTASALLALISSVLRADLTLVVAFATLAITFAILSPRKDY